MPAHPPARSNGAKVRPRARTAKPNRRRTFMADIDTTNADTLLEMGPIDYIVLEWPGQQPDGSVAPLILELVDRGLIRILDVAFLGKDENGSAFAVDVADIDAPVAVALRKSGGQLVASGRIPVQALIASLDALEAGD